MVDPFKRIVDDVTTTRTPSEQFYDDRLDRYEDRRSQWPTQIDRAAVDILYNVAVGRDGDSHAGTIDRENFGDATGAYYRDGLTTLTGMNSDLASALDETDAERLGTLAFKLNEFRNTLAETDETGLDLDRALAALVEKAATSAIDASTETTATSGRLPFDETTSVNDLLVQLFSDPDVSAYADTLIGELTEVRSESLLARLDEPIMTTPLWEPQREALQRWAENGQSGYVEMATATGKTVLGLAAVALRYGDLHPADAAHLGDDGAKSPSTDPATGGEGNRVLVVAGNNLVLEQWRREFDAHLDIPPARTASADGRAVIDLDWGRVEFRTAQDLLRASLSNHDLVILDEAHSYRRGGGETTRGWGDVFTELTAESEGVLALSGSISSTWTGDEAVRNALDAHLDCLLEYDLTEARADGIIADFDWQVEYVPADAETTDRVTEQTAVCTDYHDAESGELDLDALGTDLPEDRENRFVTYDALRAFVQSNAGRERRTEPAFDEFASALLTRRPAQWNLTPEPAAIADCIERHPERKRVVLVSGYAAAAALRETLLDERDHDPESVIALEGPTDRMSRIEAFNATDEGVIIGPGKLLGEGVDMPDAEVAINVAKGGMNLSLVQRIGRVLRNPSGDKHARFHHLLAQPVDAAALVPPEDGWRMLTRAAEFRALGERFDERPAFAATDATSSVVARLERAGCAAFDRHASLWDSLDDIARRELRALTHVVDAEDSTETPAQTRCWGKEARDETVEEPDRTHYQSLQAAADERDETSETSGSTDTEEFLDRLQSDEQDASDPGLKALKKRLDARNTSNEIGSTTATANTAADDESVEQSADSTDTPPDERATVDEPNRANDHPPNGTPMSNEQQDLSNDAPPDEDDSQPASRDERAVADADERTTALLRVALNDLSGTADEKRRIRAVETLAASGEDAVESLTRIADIENAGNEAVAARAEAALVDILFESTFESE